MIRVVLSVKWLLPIVLVALAACARSPSGDDMAAAESVAPADTTAQSQPVQPPAPASASSAEAMTATGTSEPSATFTARGNEPFWSVQVEGSALTYRTPELQEGKVLQSERSTYAKGVSFTGKDEGKDFVLDINGTPCVDSMSGENFEFTATFVHDGKTMTGCAKRGR